MLCPSKQFFDNYDEEETGPLEMDEIEGHKPEDSDVMKHILDEYEDAKEKERQRPEIRIPDLEEESASGDETELVEVEAPREIWDCESIISTYSNIYHHPKLITEPSKKVLS